MSQVPALPDLVRRAFSLPAETPVRLGRAWNNGWKIGSYVLTSVEDPQYSARIASVRACLQVPGVQIAHPIRASDGRYVFSGWQATHYLPGSLTRRADEHVAVALRLEKALREIPVSRVFQPGLKKKSGLRKEFQLSQSGIASPFSASEASASRGDNLWDLFSCADTLAWSDTFSECSNKFLDDAPSPEDGPDKKLLSGEVALHTVVGTVDDEAVAEPSYELAQELIAAARRTRCDLGDNHLCHGDVVSSLISEGTHQPTLTDFFPLLRPAGYSAALAIVDNLIAENAGLGLLHRYRHIPNIELLCLRAGAYRLLVHAGLLRRGLAQNSNIVSNVQKLL